MRSWVPRSRPSSFRFRRAGPGSRNGQPGEPLNLHVVAHGDYDTGVFAYNMIRRGERHGLRIVSSLKSQPALNVLAIYEK